MKVKEEVWSVPPYYFSTMDYCSICFDTINGSTGRVETSCGHLYHYTCLTHWLLGQSLNERPENCPCCRRVFSENECLPSLNSDTTSEDEEEDDEEIFLTQEELHTLLQELGGIGCPDKLWKRCCMEHDKESTYDQSLPFTRYELETISVHQGGTVFTDVKWETLSLLYGEQSNPISSNFQIVWRRVDTERWERIFPDQESNEPSVWDGTIDSNPPPESLALQTSISATKIQSLWRGSMVRNNLLKQTNSAIKIQQFWRNTKMQQYLSNARLLLTFTT